MSTVPYVIEQTDHGEKSYDIFSRLLADRIILLGEEASDASAVLLQQHLPFTIPCSTSEVMCLPGKRWNME